MKQTITSRLAVLLLSVGLVGFPASGAVAADSGFLKDYSQLQMTKGAKGVEGRVWASPRFTRENYQKILLEKITFYPTPQPSEDVTLGTLNDILAYSDGGLRKAIASVVPLASEPGPGVARVRMAFTAASVDKSLKPYQLIPAALVLTAASRAAGAAKYDVNLAVETEITDSVSGEVLARIVREAKGIEVKSGEKLTLQLARPQIDFWIDAARQEYADRLQAKGN